MYQDDIKALNEESTVKNTMCDIIQLGQPTKEYNHKEFIITELRRARMETMEKPSPGRILALLVWLDTLIHELDKETKEESMKIAA